MSKETRSPSGMATKMHGVEMSFRDNSLEFGLSAEAREGLDPRFARVIFSNTVPSESNRPGRVDPRAYRTNTHCQAIRKVIRTRAEKGEHVPVLLRHEGGPVGAVVTAWPTAEGGVGVALAVTEEAYQEISRDGLVYTSLSDIIKPGRKVVDLSEIEVHEVSFVAEPARAGSHIMLPDGRVPYCEGDENVPDAAVFFPCIENWQFSYRQCEDTMTNQVAMSAEANPLPVFGEPETSAAPPTTLDAVVQKMLLDFPRDKLNDEGDAIFQKLHKWVEAEKPRDGETPEEFAARVPTTLAEQFAKLRKMQNITVEAEEKAEAEAAEAAAAQPVPEIDDITKKHVHDVTNIVANSDPEAFYDVMQTLYPGVNLPDVAGLEPHAAMQLVDQAIMNNAEAQRYTDAMTVTCATNSRKRKNKAHPGLADPAPARFEIPTRASKRPRVSAESLRNGVPPY